MLYEIWADKLLSNSFSPKTKLSILILAKQYGKVSKDYEKIVMIVMQVTQIVWM
jgi:hypothetical protein